MNVFKNIDEILSYYKVKKFKVTPGEYIAIKKGGVWHYFNWSDKEKGLVKTGESDYLIRSTVRAARKK
jgi:trehalose-6-phosphatase